MSDDRRWDETRRLGPDEASTDDPAETRRIARAPQDEERTQRLDPAHSADDGRTQRLDPAHAGSDPTTQRLDAVGDSTFEDPYGEADPATGYADPDADERTGAQAPEPESEREGRDGWRTALVLLLGIGLGFVAALVVVALFGSDVGDEAVLAARDQRIAELEEQLAESEGEAAELEATVEQRDEQIADLQAGFDDAEGDLAQRQQSLDDREQSLDQREDELDQREDELDERERDLAEAEDPDGEQSGNGPPDDVDLPDIDGDDAQAFIDRIIEGIRDLFR